jgi:uncharacterized membrane protein
MTAQILAIIGSILAGVIIIFNYIKRKNSEKRKQAEQAKKDMENAKSDKGGPSDFLDSFGRFSK